MCKMGTDSIFYRFECPYNVFKVERKFHAPVKLSFSLQGTSAEQDNRFSNKHKKLLKQLKFAECLEKKVNYF